MQPATTLITDVTTISERVNAILQRREEERQRLAWKIEQHIEQGGAIVEYCFRARVYYSLTSPGPFMPGTGAPYLANHIARRHQAFGSTIEWEAK